MITVEIVGDKQVIAKLDALPGRLHDALLKRVTALSLQMAATVKQKLSGQVLQVRSGNLRRSIQSAVANDPTQVSGRIFSDQSVRYGAIHEYGGTTKPHVIEAKNGGVLAFQAGGRMMFARRVNHPGSKIPARPFMRPTLAEYRDKIVDNFQAAASEASQ